MKKEIILLSILFLLPVLAQAATTSPRISVETAFTDPYPIEPGSEVLVAISVTNDGSDSADNVVVELKPNYPFTVLENPVKNINTINLGSDRQVDYRVSVDTSAVSSRYQVPIVIKYNGLEVEKTIDLIVRGVPKFNMVDIKTGTVTPGDQEIVTVNLENIGTGKAKRTKVTFDSTSEMIKPILSGGDVYLGDVNPGNISEVKFKILASQDAEYGVYTSNINVTYEDESGNELTKVFQAGILVGGEPKLEVVKSEIDQKNQELEVEIINVGSAEAIGIKSELYINDKFFDVDYTTQLKIDKKSTLKFKIPGKVDIGDLKLSYKGPDNTKYAQEETISWVKVNGNYLIYVIIVAVVVAFLFRKKIMKLIKRKRKK